MLRSRWSKTTERGTEPPNHRKNQNAFQYDFRYLIEFPFSARAASRRKTKDEAEKKNKGASRFFHIFSTRKLGGLRAFSPEFARRKMPVPVACQIIRLSQNFVKLATKLKRTALSL